MKVEDTSKIEKKLNFKNTQENKGRCIEHNNNAQDW